ncbi:MAG TPA: DUF4178 domain-containing protein [Pyrinomonadaceae bacterium]
MTALQANCPACGAPISFKVGSSVVVVCEYCHSVVARTDRALEDLGKVAEIAETASPLQLGLRGAYQGAAFELTGRTQLGHQAGGMWDEWYAAFNDGRWGWLAEAQGRFYLTFQVSAPEQKKIPSFEALGVGHTLYSLPGSEQFVVAEKGHARTLGAQGEIPWRVVPGETYAYADLSGQDRAFGTLDYSESSPLVFSGREVTLAELGMAEARAPERVARRTTAAHLNCPNCGGPLELRAPDRTERVTCPNCSSLLDVNQGQLKFLNALKPGAWQPLIPIGAVGEFENQKLTVLGFVVRSVEFDGVTYFWQEYLLYNPQVGFRWLVDSDDHWNYVQPVPPGEVRENGDSVTFRGKTFQLFQDTTARTEYVIGEFYWKVSVGEEVRAIDYINPPEMLSVEISNPLPKEVYSRLGSTPIYWSYKEKGKAAPEAGEINCSFGTYLRVAEVEKIFGVTGLPRPSMVAPNQPNPYKGISKTWIAILALTLLVGIALAIYGSISRKQVFNQSYQMQPLPNEDGTQVIFSEPFQLSGNKNIHVTGNAPVSNAWLYVEGDLINEETGLVQPFTLPIEQYSGVEDGESWSEGGSQEEVYLSAVPAGTYTLRLEAQWEKWQQKPPPLSIQIEQGVPRFTPLFIALGLISIWPVIVIFLSVKFEGRRWGDSVYGPAGGSSESSDSDSDSEIGSELNSDEIISISGKDYGKFVPRKGDQSTTTS